jgi:hypothetical protein
VPEDKLLPVDRLVPELNKDKVLLVRLTRVSDREWAVNLEDRQAPGDSVAVRQEKNRWLYG